MGIDETIGNVASTAILAGFSLAMIKQIYPDKYEQEKRRRANKSVRAKPRKMARKRTVKKKKK